VDLACRVAGETGAPLLFSGFPGSALPCFLSPLCPFPDFQGHDTFHFNLRFNCLLQSGVTFVVVSSILLRVQEAVFSMVSSHLSSGQGSQGRRYAVQHYYLDKRTQEQSGHQVHVPRCIHLPENDERIYLGSFNHSDEALAAARTHFSDSCECPWCCQGVETP
jgi:hypothetical protein